MTELQPTEVELTGKKKKHVSISKRKLIFVISTLVFIALAVILTVILANRASSSTEGIQQQTLPAEGSALSPPQ